MIGVTAYAAYVPRLRLDRALIGRAWGARQATGEVAVANYDEDALTLACDAARECLDAHQGDPPDALYFASVSSPYREKQVAAVIATACDLPRDVRTADFAGSARAGIAAMLAATNAVRAGERPAGSTDVLVTAADVRVVQPESDIEGWLGDAGAAVRIGRTNVLAELVDSVSLSEEFTYVWRTDGDPFVRAFPGKFSTTCGFARDLGEAVRRLLKRSGLAPGAVAKVGLCGPDSRAAVELGRDMGFDVKRQLVDPAIAIGSAGVADPLLALAAILDEAHPGDVVLVGAHGEGADAVLLRVTDALPDCRAPRAWHRQLASRLPIPSYERYLKFRRVLDPGDGGEAISNVLEFAELAQNVRLHGSRCGACGTVQYPMARVCIRCRRSEEMIHCKLARKGTIFTFTIDHLIAHSVQPLPMAVVDLDGGGRVYLQVTDFLPEEVEVGRAVTLTYRRLHEGGENHNYYWKARPIR